MNIGEKEIIGPSYTYPQICSSHFNNDQNILSLQPTVK